jgi:hypothetical protein
MTRPMLRPKLVRGALAVVVASGGLTGCAPSKHLSLHLRSVAITVPRILTPAIEIVPKSSPPQVIALPPAPPLPTFTAEPVRVTTTVPSTRPTTPPKVACPAADSSSPSPIAAPADVDAPPVASSYAQSSSGAYAGSAGKGTLDGPIRTTITSLGRTTSSNGQVLDDWRIERKDQARRSTSVEQYRLVHASTASGATNAGIYLLGLSWQDPTRPPVTFQPTGNGLWVLQSPAQLAAESGVQHTNVLTDANTLTTFQFNRNVTGRKRVDACGALVDTYTVQMSGVITTPTDQFQVAWTQQLATAYGGANVEETLNLNNPTNGFSWTRTARNTSAPEMPR